MIGSNISLRALEPGDAQILYEWENDRDVWSVSNTITPYSRFDIEQYIINSGDIFTSRQLRLIIIPNSQPDTPAGAVDLFDFEPLHRRAEIGILISGNYRNKGYAGEAIDLMKSYAFNTLNLHQLYCHVPVDKEINLHLFVKHGFVNMGTRREWHLVNGKWIDEYLLQCININAK